MAITVKQFVKREIDSIELFAEWWEEQQKKAKRSPYHDEGMDCCWPDKMEVQDWVDQYFDYYNTIYLEREKNLK